MTKIFVRRLEEKTYILLLGTLVFTLAYAASPLAAWATGTHDGKFSAASNNRTTIYNNTTASTQTVLVTVCVTTTGSQTAVIEDRLSDGSTTDTLVSVRFGTCRSLTLDLPADHVIVVRAPTSVSAAGTYTVSVKLP
jgi:uridine phosphorylase